MRDRDGGEKETDRRPYRQKREGQTDRQTDRQTDKRGTDRQTDRQTDRDKHVIIQQLCQCRPLRKLSPVHLSTSYPADQNFFLPLLFVCVYKLFYLNGFGLVEEGSQALGKAHDIMRHV